MEICPGVSGWVQYNSKSSYKRDLGQAVRVRKASGKTGIGKGKGREEGKETGRERERRKRRRKEGGNGNGQTEDVSTAGF